MAFLAEYALTPDVFDVSCHSTDEVCGIHLQNLKDVLISEGLIRNLRSGEWAELLRSDQRPWHRRTKELLRKLATQKRLVDCDPAGAETPVTDGEWCVEALATHRIRKLTGIIVTDRIAGKFKTEPLVAPVHRLSSADWWASRSPSQILGRTLTDYREALGPVLQYANHIMFIDPHADPGMERYKGLTMLIRSVGGRSPKPCIELHRVCYHGSGRARRILDLGDLESSFRAELQQDLIASGVSLEVFIWDDFHDRYLISNLVGISVSNGFDTTAAPGATTTWGRLSRSDRDKIQREFDPASNRHALRRRFRIP